jgi:hypothetical protein
MIAAIPRVCKSKITWMEYMHQSSTDRSGSVISLVLIIMGISFSFIVGASVVGRGSRISTEKAVLSTLTTGVALQAVDEVMAPEAADGAVMESLLKAIGGMDPRASGLGADDKVSTFLALLDPMAMSQLRFQGDPARDTLGAGVTLVQGPANTVTFAATATTQRRASLTERCHAEEIRRGQLQVSPVKVRVVRYTLTGEPASPRAQDDGGLVRAQTTVSYRAGRSLYSRQVTVDRRFYLTQDSTEWRLHVETNPVSQEVADANALF